MIKQDTSENRVRSIYLAIGSNLGNKKNNIELAKFELLKRKVSILKSSSYYQSLSWPNPNNPYFYNIVIKISTNLGPLELIKECKKIEVKIGRKKSAKNSPRVCDIDIIDFDSKIMNSEIILPHPRMHTRNFVLLPLFEINKDWIHPKNNHHIKKLILLLSNRDITTIKKI